MSFSKNLLVASIGLLSSCYVMASAPVTIPDLNVGYPGLQQSVSYQAVTDGLDYYHVVRGQSSSMEGYILSSGALPQAQAKAIAEILKQEGYQPILELPPEFTPHGTDPGLIVRIRNTFKTADEAKAAASQLKEKDINMAVRYTAEDGYLTAGPFDINILRVDLDQYQGKIEPVLGQSQVPGRERVSKMAKKHHALAGINGGYFVFKGALGTEGAPAGLMVQDGKIVSEAINQRPGVIINNNGEHPQVTISHSLETHLSVNTGSHTYTIDGINREPGKIFNCGGENDQPTEGAIHDYLCTDDSEIILFNEAFGQKTPQGAGVEIVLNQNGTVVGLSSSLGHTLEAGQRSLQVTGKLAEQVQGQFKEGSQVDISTQLLSDGQPVELGEGIFALNGGPTLLNEHSENLLDRAIQGWGTRMSYAIEDKFTDKKDGTVAASTKVDDRIGFYNGWVLRRHPRTAVGLTDDNVLYAVVVYGRNPGVSAGANISDMKQIMDSLGAKNAVNLDGGGSSTMVVNNHLIGKPSDKNGERAVSDALLFVQ